jgi:hypothetical protein
MSSGIPKVNALDKFPDTFTYDAIQAAIAKEKLERERAAEEGFEDADEFRARIVNSFKNELPIYIDAKRVKKAAVELVIGELLTRFPGKVFCAGVDWDFDPHWYKVEKDNVLYNSRQYAIATWEGALKPARDFV